MGVHVGLAVSVEPGFLGEHFDIGARQLAHLLDLGVGEGGLGRPAASDEVDVADPALAQGLQRVVGDVGDRQLLVGAAQDARHVDGHVAHADDRGGLPRQVETAVTIVRVAVVPRHELGGRVAALEVLARNVEASVGLGSGGEADLVVVDLEVVEPQVAAVAHVAVEAEPGVARVPVIDPHHRLDLLMVRRHASPHQPERRRQLVEHVDPDVQALLAKEPLDHVETRRTRTDDGYSQRMIVGPGFRHVRAPSWGWSVRWECIAS